MFHTPDSLASAGSSELMGEELLTALVELFVTLPQNAQYALLTWACLLITVRVLAPVLYTPDGAKNTEEKR